MRALSLFSGGLDSQLAVKIIQEQGIEVIGLHFTTPFFGGSREISKAASDLGIEFREEYKLKIISPGTNESVYGCGKTSIPASTVMPICLIGPAS